MGSTVISSSLSRFATLLHQCLNSVKKGSAKEVALACHAIGSTLAFHIFPIAFRISVNIWLINIHFHSIIGLLALTTGPGEKAQEILEESVTPISEALRLRPEATKTSSVDLFLSSYFGCLIGLFF